MDDRLQLGQANRVGEDEAAQSDAIERAVGAAILPAEAGDDRLADRGAGRHQLARQLVGVDHGGAALGQPAGHGRLAAADRADQADQRGPGPQGATPRSARAAAIALRHGAASSISSHACSTCGQGLIHARQLAADAAQLEEVAVDARIGEGRLQPALALGQACQLLVQLGLAASIGVLGQLSPTRRHGPGRRRAATGRLRRSRSARPIAPRPSEPGSRPRPPAGVRRAPRSPAMKPPGLPFGCRLHRPAVGDRRPPGAIAALERHGQPVVDDPQRVADLLQEPPVVADDQERGVGARP